MRVKEGNFYTRLRKLIDIVLIALLVDLVISLAIIHMMPWFPSEADPSHWLLVGAGMVMIFLGCLAVYLRVGREAFKA